MLLREIKTELKTLGIRPKKSLGQNFLIDRGAYHKIISALEIRPGDLVIEVGPGLGTLTEHLLAGDAKVVAVEKDRKFVEYLKAKFSGNDHAIIIGADILKFDPLGTGYLMPGIDYKIVGNIPYYLTSFLLRTIFDSLAGKWPQPKLAVFMLQKEVARRICARPPGMSLLSVSIQYYARPKIISYVDRNRFYPSPKVDSAIIKLEARDRPRATKDEAGKFFRVVRAGFSGKRKQLINNLSRELKLRREEIAQKLESVGIESSRRAETLSVEEWRKVARTIYEL